MQTLKIPVSIGIPTYNRANGYMRLALQSAIDQTYEPLEIIVSDNASTDNTEEVVRSFNDHRIRYFRQPKNLDANTNFNFCLKQAKGDFFLLLHDDDLIDPDFIQTCIKTVGNRTSTGVIITGTRVIDDYGNIIRTKRNQLVNPSIREFITGWIEHRVALYLCGSLYNTKWLKEIGGFNSKHNLYQDVVATFELAARHGHVHCPDVKASFRIHGSNRGSSASVMSWCEDCNYLLEKMIKLIPGETESFQTKAGKFFCKQCYGFAKDIKDPVQRLYTYHKVYKNFKYIYSPRHFLRNYEYPLWKSYFKQHSHRSTL